MIDEKLKQDISHSVKAPLSSLHAQLSLLVYVKETLPQNLQEKVPQMLVLANNLSERVNDLLTLAFPPEITAKETSEEISLSSFFELFTPPLSYVIKKPLKFTCSSPLLMQYLLSLLHSYFFLSHPSSIGVEGKVTKKTIVLSFDLKKEMKELDKDTQSHRKLKLHNLSILLSSLNSTVEMTGHIYTLTFSRERL